MAYSIKLKTVDFRIAESENTNCQAGTPEQATAIIRTLLVDVDADVEQFGILTLNVAHCVTGFKILHTGTETCANVSLPRAMRTAINLGARGVVLFHTHPSGNATPSRDDIGLTRRFVLAGALLGIVVCDHIVFAPDNDGGFHSFSIRTYNPGVFEIPADVEKSLSS